MGTRPSATSPVRWPPWTPSARATRSALRQISDIRQRRHDPRLVFRVQLAIGALGLIAASTAVATAGASVHNDPRGAHDVVILGGHFTYPAVNAAAAVLLVLAGL